jgi:hypothetical protein
MQSVSTWIEGCNLFLDEHRIAGDGLIREK